MEKEKALEILVIYNKWRRGAPLDMPNPTEIGNALDVAIESLERDLNNEYGYED